MGGRDLRGTLARAGIVVACCVVVFALFGAWETARRNGDKLEKALDELDAQKQTNHELLVKVERQGERIHVQTVELRALRDALRDAGINPAEVLPRREASPPPGAPSSTPDDSAGRTPPTPGGGEPLTNRPRSPRGDGGAAPPPGGDPPDDPPPPDDGGDGGGEPDRPRCRVVDPLTGRCLVAADTPLDPLVDQLAP